MKGSKRIAPEEIKILKAKNLRYRKAIVRDFNLEAIQERLCDIEADCNDVRWYFDTDDDTLINALDGDEDEAFEFKMMFSDLCADCERMQEDLHDTYVGEHFNDFFVSIGSGDSGGGLLGWDSYEQDYFGLETAYEDRVAVEESRKRIMRLTKEQIIEAADICFKVSSAYIGIQHRYDCLKAAIDILRDENTGYLQIVKQIEEKYEEANREEFDGWYPATRELDRLVTCIPDEAWIQ